MKVVLIKKVDKLGQPGEVKEVADGYALNFLLPRGLAVSATTQVIEEWRHKAKVVRKTKEKDLELARKAIKKLSAMILEIRAKANDSGRLFGAITAEQILAGLREHGLEVGNKFLNYREHIKNIGEHQVGYRLVDGSNGFFTVRVVREE